MNLNQDTMKLLYIECVNKGESYIKYDIWCRLLFGFKQCYIIFTIDVIFYHVGLLMLCNVQTTSFTFLGKICDIH